MEQIHAGKEYMDFEKPEDGSAAGFGDDTISHTQEEVNPTATPEETLDPEATDVLPEDTLSPEETTSPTESSEHNGPKNTPAKEEPVNTPGGNFDDVGEDTTTEDVGNLTE